MTDKGNVLPFKVVHTSETPGCFNDSRALIYSKSNKYGYIDWSGKFVIDTVYQTGHDFSEALAGVRTEKCNGNIDRNGKEVISMDQKYSLMPFNDGIALISDFKKWGAIDKNSKIIIPLEYSEIEFFQENYAVAVEKEEGLKGLIDKNGKFVIEPLHQSLADVHEGLLSF